MVLVLTNVTNSEKILVNSEDVKLWELNPTNKSQTDVVFGPGLVRVVVETLDQIKAALGAVTFP